MEVFKDFIQKSIPLENSSEPWKNIEINFIAKSGILIKIE